MIKTIFLILFLSLLFSQNPKQEIGSLSLSAGQVSCSIFENEMLNLSAAYKFGANRFMALNVDMGTTLAISSKNFTVVSIDGGRSKIYPHHRFSFSLGAGLTFANFNELGEKVNYYRKPAKILHAQYLFTPEAEWGIGLGTAAAQTPDFDFVSLQLLIFFQRLKMEN